MLIDIDAKFSAMQRYQNKGGDSGVTHYQIGDGEIIVRFQGGAEYVYNHIKPGQHHVSQMQQLAVHGEGLNAYIKRYVNKNFFSNS